MPRPVPVRGAAKLALLLLASLAACGTLGERSGDVERLAPDLTRWRGDPRFWSVRDGVLVGESTAENPCERTTYLVWDGGEGDGDGDRKSKRMTS